MIAHQGYVRIRPTSRWNQRDRRRKGILCAIGLWLLDSFLSDLETVQEPDDPHFEAKMYMPLFHSPLRRNFKILGGVTRAITWTLSFNVKACRQCGQSKTRPKQNQDGSRRRLAKLLQESQASLYRMALRRMAGVWWGWL
jgi:hypothetical protein